MLQGKAFQGSWTGLYIEICSKLSIDTPDKTTNKQRQDAIMLCVSLRRYVTRCQLTFHNTSQIHNDCSKWDQLSRFLPTSKRKELEQTANSESMPDSETEDDGTEGESDASTSRSEDSAPEVLARLEEISDRAHSSDKTRLTRRGGNRPSKGLRIFQNFIVYRNLRLPSYTRLSTVAEAKTT